MLKDFKVQWEPKVLKGPQQELKVPKVLKEEVVQQVHKVVIQEPKVLKDFKVQWEPKVLKEPQQEPKVPKVLKEEVVIQVLKVPQ